jgi:hypothetical protein
MTGRSRWDARSVRRHLWASPVSLAALPFVLLALVGRGRVRLRSGVLEVSGGLLAPVLARAVPGFPIAAITLGHVVAATDARALSECRVHENVHVAQYERWGALFPLLYLASSAAAWLAGGRAYRDNVFEREACLVSGETRPT